MALRSLGTTGLQIPRLVFGGNVFGWTVDEKQSFSLLDALLERGFSAIDTADVYSAWAPGNKGGESETIIGKWFAAHPGVREKVTLFTKVGADLGEPGKKGLSARWIEHAVNDSLRRLQTDYIDLYFSHWPDSETPYDETLGAYQKLLNAGKIRAVGASNLNAEQLQASLSVADDNDLPRYQVLQPEYNLYDRDSFEGKLQELTVRENIGVVTYYSLASGFLSGKYRSESDLSQSQRGQGISKYLNPRGFAILDAVDKVAAKHNVKPAEIALAWLIAQPGVTAPIASATKIAHIESFVTAVSLTLSSEDIAALNNAGQ
ncbi:TPA: aldo/keto reductase [Kluyvera intermedia]|uniref:Alcohol dehydrogenase n=2 Tax=Enterobacteriaceae TaxID=543 RepID=A0AAC8QT50_9ENTR|nr:MULTISPECIES: aldo/keto reductase [Enterobacteriaceae]MDU6687069.1 aldo/keto reductase [Enterobacteriaceae bacterium]HAT2204344.1 aldo/keto reductase [Kluyvera intermedia]AKL14426.1 alcohol dehydrogenase [Phytobacter ursingii]MCL9672997.1 aldo/keto reductase [Citrobacter sp. MNAZ 1397]HAT2517214.1 aldo/keto reductase [Kluyvera intermedia]